jgi:hypothetical protein
MKLSLFTDLIDALGKVAGGLKAIVNLPKAEREVMHQTLDGTYRLIDTTLNRVIIRLGDILKALMISCARPPTGQLRRMDVGGAATADSTRTGAFCTGVAHQKSKGDGYDYPTKPYLHPYRLDHQPAR